MHSNLHSRRRKPWELKGSKFNHNIIIGLFVCFWRYVPQWTRASLFTRFLDHTQRHTTVGRTPLDEWSARRRGLYLTTHTTEKRPCPRWDSNSQSQQASGHWDRLIIIDTWVKWQEVKERLPLHKSLTYRGEWTDVGNKRMVGSTANPNTLKEKQMCCTPTASWTTLDWYLSHCTGYSVPIPRKKYRTFGKSLST
jgi:hypothetical protein